MKEFGKASRVPILAQVCSCLRRYLARNSEMPDPSPTMRNSTVSAHGFILKCVERAVENLQLERR